MLRRCRSRSALIAASSVGPSTPWFHERLNDSPSWLASPLAPLCFSLYDTRSTSVNPSWHVTKLTDAVGLRVAAAYRSELPVKREPNSDSVAGSPRHRSRIVSR